VNECPLSFDRPANLFNRFGASGVAEQLQERHLCEVGVFCAQGVERLPVSDDRERFQARAIIDHKGYLIMGICAQKVKFAL
jgi:hypothetical protein